jgi:hypothetical protein
MHKELLSDKERQMLKQFLTNGEKGEGFRMLKMRIKKNYVCIAEDFKLIKEVKDRL